MLATPTCKYKTNLWKDKLRICKKDIKTLKKDYQRLSIRFENSRQTVKLQQIELVDLRESVSKLGLNLTLGPKPKQHKYQVAIGCNSDLYPYFKIL